MTGVGVIGCGMVSHAYLGTIARSDQLKLVGLASRTFASAEAQAGRYGGQAMPIEALLADRAIEVVVNLAPPAFHYPISRRILEAGKHLYSEKPFATNLADAATLLELADLRGLSVGCAPDTFLGEGHQATRRLVDEGAIGKVLSGAIAFGSPGMEHWHPDPAAFYASGGGPLLDVGPYYITQLVNLLGPVTHVIAIGSAPRSERIVSSTGREGQVISVEVPTDVVGALRFADGANVSLAMSWDVRAHSRPPIELYGDRGTLTAPDPNRFSGINRVTLDGGDWTVFGEASPAKPLAPSALTRAVAALMAGIDPVTGNPVDQDTGLRLGDLRGAGLVDMVTGLAEGRPPRASGALALHVLEVVLGLERAISSQSAVMIASRPNRPDSIA